MRPILVLAYFSLISLELSSPEEFQAQPVPNNVATLRSKSNIPAALQNKITTTVSPSELFFKVVTTKLVLLYPLLSLGKCKGDGDMEAAKRRFPRMHTSFAYNFLMNGPI